MLVIIAIIIFLNISILRFILVRLSNVAFLENKNKNKKPSWM